MRPVTIALLLLGSFAPRPTPAAHPFHTSTAEVEFNPASGRLEVALKVYSADLETALRRMDRSKVDLDNESVRDRLLKKYIASRFRIEDATPGHPPSPPTGHRTDSFHYVGSEIQGGDIWVYFELVAPARGQRFTLRNTVLTDVQPEQMNAVFFRGPVGTESLYFSATHVRRTLSLTERLPQPPLRKSGSH